MPLTDSIDAIRLPSRPEGSDVRPRLQNTPKIATCWRFLHFWLLFKIMKKTMKHNIHTLKEAGALALQIWREAARFFLSIELALMVLVAAATVAGVWLAVLQDARSLLAFGFAIAYVAVRTVLHVKRKLTWPFI